MAKFIVLGSGIVGLAVARELVDRGHQVSVLEKEDGVARHQTGRNSGVIHSGLYYVPGSQKAIMCQRGAASMVAFARDHGIAHRVTGKLVVAVAESEIRQLEILAERAARNGVPARRVSPAEARGSNRMSRVSTRFTSKPTGIIDYSSVCEVLAELIRDGGGELHFGQHFVAARTTGRGVVVETDTDQWHADAFVNCGGLHSDRIALASGVDPQVRIVPFRGEYYELTPQSAHLVNGLIYPVPDPRFPFLGVHLTAMIDGSVHAGPNAVLALAREGYSWGEVRLAELANALAWPGLWRLAAKNLRPGTREVARSLSKRLFVESLARLVPEITTEDVVKSEAGVRAQALNRDGSLVDDFAIQTGPRQVHVLNAPSPAATASLEIARHIGDMVEKVLA